MFCSKCGIESKEKMKFCSNCGENLVFEAVKEDQEKGPMIVGEDNVEPKETIIRETTDASNVNKKVVPFAQQSTSNLTIKDKMKNKCKEVWNPIRDKIKNKCKEVWNSITDKMKNKCKEIWNHLSLFSKILTVLVAISVSFGLIVLLDEKTDKYPPSSVDNGPMYKISIDIECTANLIFSRYDLKIFVDSKEIGTLKHGEKSTFNADLENGKHTLEFQNADDSYVKGDVDFEVNQNSSFKYNIVCKNDKVNIEEIKKINPPIAVSELGDKSFDDVKKLFTDVGFINVTTKEIKGLTVDEKDKSNKASDISIDGKSDFTKDTTYSKDVAVVITYHTFSEEEALKATFPVENAKRVAVVAITNAIATDVFATDGNTYDASKFHSYADTSGNFYNYYIKVNLLGTWTVKNEKSWHVVSLELEHALGNVYKLDLDVNFDGTNYSVSNIKGTFGRSENVQDISGVVSENDKSIYLKIPADLIKNDRDNTKLDTHNNWVDSQFSLWDGSNKDFNALIKERLNDENSFKHIETTYIEIVNEEIRDTINKTIKASNQEVRVEIGDLWITTKFSAKNAFNGTVKNTAFGIASFKEDAVTLVAIE